MMLFDNIYYLLYNFLKRTNLGTYGYKLTSISLTSLYVYSFVCLFYSIINILYYLYIIDSTKIIVELNHPAFIVNKDIFIFGSIICFIYSIVRYFAFKSINEIYQKRNDMDMSKRERLDVLTVTYMVASPFLLFFVVNYLRNF